MNELTVSVPEHAMEALLYWAKQNGYQTEIHTANVVRLFADEDADSLTCMLEADGVEFNDVREEEEQCLNFN